MKMLKERQVVRSIHIIGAVLIGTYIYSPWSSLEWFTLLNQLVVVPVLTLSGLWMWKGHKIRATLKKSPNNP